MIRSKWFWPISGLFVMALYASAIALRVHERRLAARAAWRPLGSCTYVGSSR